MRPLHNALALGATVLAAGALLPWSARFRLGSAGLAGILIAVLLVVRLRDHSGARGRRAFDRTQQRIDRIRAARARRPPR